MNQDHIIVNQVYAAKHNPEAANELVKNYLPFIKAEAAKYGGNTFDSIEEAQSIAMFAFHESVLNYSRLKGPFLAFASINIRNRLIDHYRKGKKHAQVISFEAPVSSTEEDSRTLIDQLATSHNPVEERHSTLSAKEEIQAYAHDLSAYDFTLSDIAENCPKQKRTLSACHLALTYVRQNPIILQELVRSKKLPITALSNGSGVEKKTLERHRKYMVAILLAYTNGFEIIRGHLSQIAPTKGGFQQ